MLQLPKQLVLGDGLAPLQCSLHLLWRSLTMNNAFPTLARALLAAQITDVCRFQRQRAGIRGFSKIDWRGAASIGSSAAQFGEAALHAWVD